MTITPHVGGALEELLERSGRFFTPGEFSADLRTVTRRGGREADVFYRDRWSHDKVVRSTHGVNCTGSCSWKIYVKDGIITWETQQTDYPSVGPDRPEYEPRGCPRGASFSWYSYAPTRLRYPYARGVLIEMYREAKARLGDPVLAWADIQADPQRRRRYQQARGKGGLVRVSWAEATELIAAAHVYTIKTYGPDRVAGFSPIPAMSMVSYAAGSRFFELIGAPMTSFYDWYADLPVASPQVFGDQTDVPESGDWWDAAYLMMWGSNVPITRTPDAHWMAEARYRGTKVVTVSPDYADNTKFADEWMPCAAGTDGALAMAMGHVILSECYVRKQVPFFADFARRYTDLPFLIKLEQRGEMLVPGKNLTAADLGEADKNSENAALKPAVLDETTGTVVVPHGSLGFRYGEDGVGKWNLDLGDLLPALSVQGAEATNGDRRTALVHLPSFDTVNGEGATVARGVPVRRVGKHLVCTVFDLMLAHYGVARAGLPGQWPTGYDDPTQPNTPAWQEPITGVSAAQAIRVAREFARSAEESGGRSMIIMGGGICHWFHGDAIYRAVLALLMLTGSMGRNGGGWAHYVGQEKIRPLTGFQTMSMATDWVRPPRQVPGASYWYAHADQWRYDGYGADKLASPVGRGRFTDKHTMDVLASAVAMGWSPYYPQFDRSSLDLADEAHEAGRDAGEYVAQQLAQRKLKLAVTDPDNPVNWPRVLTVWRANLIGSSGKGGEYFLRHLLGTDSNVQAAPPRDGIRPVDVACEGDIPEGKLDLMMSIDFRMTSTTLVSDVVLPAATWYEKADISSTDMHPYVHAFSAATDPPWETRSDFDAFAAIARAFSAMAKGHLGTRSDVVLTALQHDTPDAMTFPGGAENDWLHTGATPVPGRTMGKITVVERDYTAIYDKWLTLGPLVEKFGLTTKGVTVHPFQEVQELAARFGVLNSGAAAGRPAITTAARMADVLLLLSGTTNGRLAVEGFRELEKRTGQRLAHLAEGSEDRRISYADTQARPVPVITSPEWSGSETGGRRYAPFTINIENLKPFHTLTGRMHFYLAHDWIEELGEHLPVFRPPLDMARLFGHPELSSRSGDGIGLTVRYLTPHSKWSFHSTYQDNLYMLSLSRGGPTMWMSPGDAAKIQVRDNDWVEAVNANGIYVCRAIVSHRIPDGVVFVYHVQERTVDTPRTETNNKRGGNHNALTRIRIKPSHLAGGYGQHAFAFNYLGPTGNQRDEVTVVRRRSQEVRYQ
ncbi:nitrate reductase subunit alpha [Mycobacterium kansasii]|uniref:Nitrate reductase alpha subunit n=5 Tax=Mycobacterium kansasii TaxID=1768 RepID=A0A653F6F2_MYCKA|nr:nitrate reductase subunit alpha [Mycobacterium kansasii]AGZ50111.1 nitrate reductase A subunit alpha [Mycobacterium kansasii ATCC 12478]ARG58021.1 nitrate reductase subunit alpha [Mycobacterium kansasii]ARG71180.1 nitrate reductase subunit alpha [Mycobacterium kansasii]ARG74304.1 nitrate reductase subunit alpha [Mycobacterium kansasii]ARG79727.1 nitrate reductase subunit alpha [Mycobacterium kansasii]